MGWLDRFGPTEADVREAYRKGVRDGERRIWKRWLASLMRPNRIPFDAPDDVVIEAKEEEERKRAAGR